MRTLLLALIFGLHSAVLAQTLSSESEKIKTAFLKLSADTSNKELQLNYINAFPSDSKTFLAVFHSSTFDQLYDNSHDYLNLFEYCGKKFPENVIGKSVDISKNLVWDADATGYMQHISVKLACWFPVLFVKKYNTLTGPEKNKLVAFYADVENHPKFPEYQKLIDQLKSVGSSDVAKKLELARTNRQKRQDH